jgi:cell wall-associated NlpC family hydrolase
MEERKRPRILRRQSWGVLLLGVLLTACAPFQRGEPSLQGQDAGTAIAREAESQLGAPYRYGGAGPDAFDCSGLVYFVHHRMGMEVPRTAAQQFAAATPVKQRDLRPGDLVFFRLAGRKVSHVGIYTGDDRFIHAPQRGGEVRFASLEEEYFRRSFAGAGRLHQ